MSTNRLYRWVIYTHKYMLCRGLGTDPYEQDIPPPVVIDHTADTSMLYVAGTHTLLLEFSLKLTASMERQNHQSAVNRTSSSVGSGISLLPTRCCEYMRSRGS